MGLLNLVPNLHFSLLKQKSDKLMSQNGYKAKLFPYFPDGLKTEGLNPGGGLVVVKGFLHQRKTFTTSLWECGSNPRNYS